MMKVGQSRSQERNDLIAIFETYRYVGQFEFVGKIG